VSATIAWVMVGWLAAVCLVGAGWRLGMWAAGPKIRCQHLHARSFPDNGIVLAPRYMAGVCDECGTDLEERPYTTATPAQDRRLVLPVDNSGAER
jgi:hypothetical protein